MPLLDEEKESGGYSTLIEHAFLKSAFDQVNLNAAGLPEGSLAVVFDKNEMEASGYASALATLSGEAVYKVKFYNNDEDPLVRFVDKVMQVRKEGEWIPIRACFRYVTQQPWNRIPIDSRTKIFNPVITCLAGGRNKLVASKAYEFYNGELEGTGLHINTPETIHDLSKAEIPLWVNSFGGHAVVKVPYSNAGQGVFTITNEEELAEFMDTEFFYDKFILQGLIGNSKWSSTTKAGQYYHIGTLPDRKNDIFCADLRMMVCSQPGGLGPVACYARMAHHPLADDLEESEFSTWDMLGTNLSVKLEGANNWDTETGRLVLMDRKDFNKLGIGIDTLIDSYVQTVLCLIAIDKMCIQLLTADGSLNRELFASLCNDEKLLSEIME